MARRLQSSALLATLLLGPALGVAADHFPWETLARRPDDWYRGAEGRSAAANVLSHQSAHGSWPKNLDTSARRFEGDRAQLKGTFDNGATTGEIRFLARAYRATGEDRCRSAAEKGLEHILSAQYPTGGWPQTYPPGPAYHRHITFNDDAMVRILELLRDVGRSDDFTFLPPERRLAASRAFDSGIRCIVRCQILVDGRPTVWCAQHDEKTLEPRPGRSFEPASLSGSESAGVLILLMSLEHPEPDVIRAIESGVRWFEGSKLTGTGLDRRGGDLKVIPDPDAPPLWPRFVEIGGGRPIFSGRDGVIRHDIARIDRERRNGYAWYGSWGRKVADRHADWQRLHEADWRLPAP